MLIPRIDYVFASDGNTQFDSYRAGELDMTDTVPENAADRLRRERSTELMISPILITAYYGLNLSAPPCAGESWKSCARRCPWRSIAGAWFRALLRLGALHAR